MGNSKSTIYFITGIDTDIGKSIATGLLARYFSEQGVNVITQKLVQTGCEGISEDILIHRKLMGIELLQEDKDGITCPYIFSVPCSPHLAAELDDTKIELEKIDKATQTLSGKFELILLEGAGGLHVPLTADFTLVDYIEKKKYPTILVSSSRLGSINHTLGSLEVASKRNIEVSAVIYNRFGDSDKRITHDTKAVIASYMKRYGFDGPVLDLYPLEKYQDGSITYDFSKLQL